MTGLTAQTSAELESRAEKAIPHGIVSLAEVTREHKKVVGNKAALLGELHAAGLPVAPGIVLCAQTCQGLRASRSFNPEQLQALESKIDSMWPDCTSFAIRTSAIEGERAAQQNLRDTQCEYFVPRDALTIAIIAAASAPKDQVYLAPARDPQTAGALHYKRIELSAVDRAVIVQPMVAANVSGTTHAGTLHAGASENYKIESCWGLGRTLVTGQSDPDRYQVDSKGAVISKVRGRKQHQLKGNGSGLLLSVSEPQRLEWTLDADQLKKVVALAKRCATVLGGTQDIEFALTDDELVVLQSRPVEATRLAPENVPGGKWVISLARLENFAQPFTPLTEDLLQGVLPDFAQMIHGRIYLDVAKLNARLPLSTTEDELTQTLLDCAPRSEATLGFTKLLRCVPFWISRAPWAAAFWWRSRSLENKQMDEFWSYADKQANNSELDVRALFNSLLRGNSTFSAPWRLPFVVNLTTSRHLIYGALLQRLVKRWARRPLDGATLQQLCANNPDSLSHKMTADIAALGQQVAKTPQLKKAFESSLDGLLLHKVLNTTADTTGAFAKDLNSFVQSFGHRGARELELANARWLEEPEPVLAMIGAASRCTNKETTKKKANEAYRSELLARDDLHQSLSSRLQRRVIDHLVQRIRYHVTLRDNSQHYAAHALFLVRKRMLRLEDRLLREQKLTCAGDLFFLSWNDITYLDNGQLSPDDAETLIAAAKDQHAERSAQPLQLTLGFDDAAGKGHSSHSSEELELPHVEEALAEKPQQPTLDILQGRGAAPGEREGLARVVTNERELVQMEPGEVLVLRTAEPTMAPAMQLASAVVCERGGSMGYLSTLAREMGIPLIVSAENCTKAVATGEQLKVNGETGRIIVLAANEATEKKDPGGRGIGERGTTAGVLGSEQSL